MDLRLELKNTGLILYKIDAHSDDGDLHSHGDWYQMSIPIHGIPSMQYNATKKKVDLSERLVVSPGEVHRHWADSEPASLLLVSLRQSFVEEVLSNQVEKEIKNIEINPWKGEENKRFLTLAEGAFKRTLTTPLHKLEWQEYECELVSLFLSTQEGSHSSLLDKHRKYSPNHPVVKRMLDYIREHYYEESLSLDELMMISGVSKYHLIRLFRENLGITPSQFISDYRVHRAEQMLRTTMKDVTTIAFETGFGSLLSFQRMFKRKFGMSATEYRKKEMLL